MYQKKQTQRRDAVPYGAERVFAPVNEVIASGTEAAFAPARQIVAVQTVAFRRGVLFLSALFLSVLWTLTADAQQQEVPPTVDPSQLERQFERERLPESQLDIVIPKQEDMAPEDSDAIRFTLTGLVVEGSTVYGEADFLPFYQKRLGTEITLTQAYSIARALTTKYRNDGYILSQVIVPPQRIEGGVLRLRAVEGFIDKVTVNGDVAGGGRLLRRYGEKIRNSRPLKADVLERYILLAGDLPGMTAQAVLSASPTTPGASDLDIVVREKRLEGFASVDNRGSRFSGPVQGQLGVSLNSLFGTHERTRFRFIGAAQLSELRSYEAEHVRQIGSEGLTVAVLGRYTESEPGGALEDSEIESESISAELLVNYPIIRTRAKNLNVRAGFSFRDTETAILDTPFTDDRIRAARAGLSYDFVDAWEGINLVDVEVSRGLGILDASEPGAPELSRAGADTTFTKVNLSLFRLQRLGGGFSLLLNAIGQYSDDRLVASEEFAIGGSRFGRAFDPSQVSGDRGVAGRVELRNDRAVTSDILEGIQFYAFYDYGSVWRRSAGGLSSSRDELSSTGAGARLYLGEAVTANIEMVVPVIGDAASRGDDGDNVRALFGVSVAF